MNLTKKALFATFTLVVFLVLLGSIEFGARYFQPNLIPRFFTEVTYDGIVWNQINRSYLSKYFSSGDFIIPELKPSLFRKKKTESTFRILCIGESSMFGVPYQMNANIPGFVRKQLRHLFPGKEIEVVNLGGSAINSNVMVNLLPEYLSCQPDLVLLYVGHNEFYGPDGIGATLLERSFPSLIQWRYEFRDLATVRAIRGMLR